jgi:hypothetical protein
MKSTCKDIVASTHANFDSIWKSGKRSFLNGRNFRDMSEDYKNAFFLHNGRGVCDAPRHIHRKHLCY